MNNHASDPIHEFLVQSTPIMHILIPFIVSIITHQTLHRIAYIFIILKSFVARLQRTKFQVLDMLMSSLIQAASKPYCKSQ
jgi:hypothetical protein